MNNKQYWLRMWGIILGSIAFFWGSTESPNIEILIVIYLIFLLISAQVKVFD